MGLALDMTRVLHPVAICMLLSVYIYWSTSSVPRACHDNVVPQARASWDVLGFDRGEIDVASAITLVVTFSVTTVISTFCLVKLYLAGGILVIRVWLAVSVATSLAAVGSRAALAWLQSHCLLGRTDIVTFGFLLWNFTCGGVLAVMGTAPRKINQGYLVVISALTANMLGGISAGGVWAILIAFVIWDLYAVLSTSGPLRRLVEISHQRNERIPALIYDTNPAADLHPTRRPSPPDEEQGGRAPTSELTDHVPKAEDGDDDDDDPRASASDPMLARRPPAPHGAQAAETPPKRYRRHLQLGLGDFIFYSMLVLRSSKSGLTPALASSLAILVGLTCTLLLAVQGRRALPALPISVVLGIVVHFVSRDLLGPFLAELRSGRLLFTYLRQDEMVRTGLEAVGSAGVICANSVPGGRLAAGISTFVIILVTRAHAVPAVSAAFFTSNLAKPRRREVVARLVAQAAAAVAVSSLGLSPFLVVEATVAFHLVSSVLSALVALLYVRSRKYEMSMVAYAALAASTLLRWHPNGAAVLASSLQFGFSRAATVSMASTMFAGAASGLVVAARLDRKLVHWWTTSMSAHQERMGRLGTAGLAAYGILNTLYYSIAFTVVFVRGNFTAQDLAKVWALTWAGSQVTKPIRFALAVALAPAVQRFMVSAGLWRPETENKAANPAPDEKPSG